VTEVLPLSATLKQYLLPRGIATSRSNPPNTLKEIPSTNASTRPCGVQSNWCSVTEACLNRHGRPSFRKLCIPQDHCCVRLRMRSRTNVFYFSINAPCFGDLCWVGWSSQDQSCWENIFGTKVDLWGRSWIVRGQSYACLRSLPWWEGVERFDYGFFSMSVFWYILLANSRGSCRYCPRSW